MSVMQLDLQLSQCSSVHILRRCAIARYKYFASHDIRKNAHVHRYLLPLPLTSTTMASPLPSPRSPSLHRADGHASSFRSSPTLVEEDALVFRSLPLRDVSPFHSSPPLVEEDASVFRSSPRRDTSLFRSSPPLVEEDTSVFRSLPRRVEVDASAFPISPARVPEDASAPR